MLLPRPLQNSFERVNGSLLNIVYMQICTCVSVRNALHLAVDSENIEMIELLLDKLGFDGIEEALLHTISKGHTKIVKA